MTLDDIRYSLFSLHTDLEEVILETTSVLC